MNIDNLFCETCCYTLEPAVRVLPGGEEPWSEAALPAEHLLKVCLNGAVTMRVVCSPSQLPELVLGRLLTEGIIAGTEEVEAVCIDASGTRAEVALRRSAEGLVPAEAPLVCSTGSPTWREQFGTAEPPRPVVPIPLKKEWIFALGARFEQGTPIHTATGGTHSCFLAREGEILFSCEDIGRHNALDKAVGHALRAGVDLRQAVLFTSGRVPVDMAMKAIRAGVPALVSKAVPTAQAVALAKEYQLTLICSARQSRMTVFSGAVSG